MRFRNIVIFSGETFEVPQRIQRIDTRSTHGWQVRYQGTKMFSDHTSDGSGAKAALTLATKELIRRLTENPAPVALQRAPSTHKTSGLPSGISGPIVRQRPGSETRTAHLSVLLPQFGQKPKCTSVYIGTEATYSADRYRQALSKAIGLRQEAEQAYEEAAGLALRKSATVLRKGLRANAAAAR
jgi:hypothetical protein